MLNNLPIQNVLFLDIETVPEYPSFSDLKDPLKKLWEKKSSFLKKEENEGPEELYARAGIYSEFGKIICISVGIINSKENHKHLRLKSYAGKDEKKLLEEFAAMLISHSKKKKVTLCAHNGKEFDFPYMARRMIINNIGLPEVLNIAGAKPWETGLLDTMELWKFGDYKHYTSLELLTTILGIPSPKNDIDGSMVANKYYKEDDLPSIVEYCQRDVVAIVQLMLRYKGEELIQEANIEVAG